MPPEIPDVVQGQPVESAWGNDVRDRVTMRYADLSALQAGEPVPDVGALRWLDDPGELVVWNGSAWLTVLDQDGGFTIGPGLVDLERTASGFLRATRTGTNPGIVGRVVMQISSGWVVDLSDADGADSYRPVAIDRSLANFMVGGLTVDDAGLVELRKSPAADAPLMQWQLDGSYGGGRRYQWRRGPQFGNLELWVIRPDSLERRLFTCDDQGRFWPDALQSGGYPDTAGDQTALEARTGEANLYDIIGQLLDRIEALEGS